MRRWAAHREVVFVAALYVMVGLAGKQLVLASGFASPVWPAGGLALAVLLAVGARGWPGVWLGAFLLHVGLDVSVTSAAAAMVIATGATLQALLGVWLTRRVEPSSVPQAAREWRLLRLLLAVGPFACVVSASFGIAALLGSGQVEPIDAPSEWLIWWAGDTVGVLLFTPLVLLVWPGVHPLRVRRSNSHRVALPLLLTATLLAAGNLGMNRMEENQARVEVEHRLEDAYDSGFLPLPAAIAPLNGITHLFAASEVVTRQEFALYTEFITAHPALLAVDWAPRVPRAARQRFEAAVQREGLPGYHIFELSADRQPRASADRPEYFPILYSEPQGNNGMALGLDHGFETPRRLAMARASDSAKAATSVQVELMRSNQPALLVFLPVQGAGSGTGMSGASGNALRGYVVGVFDIGKLLAPLAAVAHNMQLVWRVSDVTAGQPVRVLQDTLPAGAAPGWFREVSFGGRIWRLEMQPARTIRPAGVSAMVALYLGFSVLVALLAAFATLGSAGRIAATAAEVVRRTKELESELLARRTAETALRESEQDLDITLHSIGDAVLTTDSQRRVTRLNAVAERFTGWTEAEAFGRPVDEVFRIVDAEPRQVMAIPVDEVLRSTDAHGVDHRAMLMARDGSERVIALSAAPIRDAVGKLRGLVLVFRDISQARAAEIALQASEERYRHFIEASPFAVLVLCDGHFVFANPKAVTMFGARSPDDLLGRTLLGLVHADSYDVMHERARLRAEGRPVNPTIEAKFRRPDGSFFLGEITSVAHQYEGRLGSLILLHDITARREAEEQRDRFFSLSLDLLCIAGVDGYFKRVNPAFSHTLGWSEATLLALPFVELVHPDDLAATRTEIEKLSTGQSTVSFENRFRCKNGAWRWLEWKALPQPDGLIFATAHDTTAQHEAAARLQQLNADLTEAREDAEQASRAKSAFLATMSHEIRTPMNGVIGLVDVLAKSPLSAHQVDLISTIQDSSSTLLSLIDDILDFSKIEAGKLEIEREPLSVADLVEVLCNTLVYMADQRGVDLSVFVAPDIPERVLADEVRLRQVLYNLVGNAIKFSVGRTGMRGRVSVRVSMAHTVPPQLSMRIADNGIGIAPEKLSDLFAPFSQVESSTTRRFGGTGLGLAICRRLVDLMHGAIAVESTPGMGSIFTVTLPLEIAAEQPVRELPDLADIRCVVVRAPEMNADDLGVYLEHAGAQVWIADEGAAELLATSLAEPVVMVDGPNEAGPSSTGARSSPHDRRVHLIRGRPRHAPEPEPGPKSVMLGRNALRREALLGAVAVVAGRRSAENSLVDCDKLTEDEVIPPPTVVEARAQGRLILVAEDDEISQKVILQQLALLGYAAEIAHDGAEALRMWRNAHYAMLLTDLHMPEMDGYLLAETIRNEEAGQRRMPILALTANALRGEARRVGEAGMDEYLTKPIRLHLLKATLARWLPPENTMAAMIEPHERASSMPIAPVMDVSVLIGLVGSDPEIIQKFLGNYKASAKRLAMELQAAFAQRNVPSVATMAHKLKSSSRAVGALALGDLCAAAESACRAGDGAGIERTMERFDAVLPETEARIAELLKRS